MTKNDRIDKFVSRCLQNLPDSLSARKEDLVTLLLLLPKAYPRRFEIVKVLDAIHAHEQAQMSFLKVINGGQP